MTRLAVVSRALFDAGAAFLNTATVGIPPAAAVDAMAAATDDWRHGVLRPTDFDPLVDRGRAARVLTADGDFTSVLFPLLAQSDRNVTVESVPLESLPDAHGPADLR
jgi:hypothetical protein